MTLEEFWNLGKDFNTHANAKIEFENTKYNVSHRYPANEVGRIDKADMNKYVWPAKFTGYSVDESGSLVVSVEMNPKDYSTIIRKVDYAIGQAVMRSQVKLDFEPED